MPNSDTNTTSLWFSEETVWNENPTTPTMAELQRVSDTFQHQKNTVVPATIRTDRLQEDIINVGAQGSGGFAYEFRHTQYDALIAAQIGAASFTIAAITATDISAAAADDSFNTAAGNFVTAGVVVGMWIKVAGFTGGGITADNGYFRVLTVTTLKITVDAALIDDAAGESITITGKMARNGITKRSFLFEKRFTDVTQFQQMRGMRPSSMTLEVRASQIITGNMEFMGARGLYQGTSVAGSSVAAASNPAFDASANVFELLEAGTALTTPLQSFSITINGNAGVQPAIANTYPIGVRYGTLELSGTVVAYFSDAALLTKFVNHTPSSMVFKLRDGNGKAVIFSFFRLFFAEGQTPVQGQNQDVFVTLPFRASYDSVSGYGIQYDSLA
jgi:hypothetical protein